MVINGERETEKDPKVSDKCVHVFGRLQTKLNNQTVERFACQTEEQTRCKKAQRTVRMFRESRWGSWRRARHGMKGAGGVGGQQWGGDRSASLMR